MIWSLSSHCDISNAGLRHEADVCGPQRQVRHGHTQNMPPKGGGGVLGMSATLPCTRHLTNRLQDMKTAIISARLCGLRVLWKSMAVLPVLDTQGSLSLCACRRCSQSPRALRQHCPLKNAPHLTRTSLSTFLCQVAGDRAPTPQAPHCVHAQCIASRSVGSFADGSWYETTRSAPCSWALLLLWAAYRGACQRWC